MCVCVCVLYPYMYVRCAFAVFTVAVSAVECGGCAVSAAGMQFRQRSSRRVCRYVGVCMQSSPALQSVADGGPVLVYLPRRQCVQSSCSVSCALPPPLPPSPLSLLCFYKEPIARYVWAYAEIVYLAACARTKNQRHVHISLTKLIISISEHSLCL